MNCISMPARTAELQQPNGLLRQCCMDVCFTCTILLAFERNTHIQTDQEVNLLIGLNTSTNAQVKSESKTSYSDMTLPIRSSPLQ